MFEHMFVFFELLGIVWCPQSLKYFVLGVMDTPAKSGNVTNMSIRFFSQMNPKSYSSKMKQNDYTELLGMSFNQIL